MKKQLFTLCLIACLILSGCSTKEKSNSEKSSTEATTETTTETIKRYTVKKQEFELNVGESEKIEFDEEFPDNVTFESLNTDIITVTNEGTISAIAAGNTTVKCTTDGNTINCPIIVKEKENLFVDLKDVPYSSNINEKIATALVEIGVSDVTAITYYNYSSDSSLNMLHLNSLVKTESKILHIKLMNILDVNAKWFVSDITNESGTHHYYPLESKAVDLYDYKTDKLIRKANEDFDPVEDFNERSESIEESFSQALDDIAKEAGLE